MAYTPGPLHDAAWYIGRVGSNFHDLALEIRDVPLLGRWLYARFWWVYEETYRVAHWLEIADQRFDWSELSQIFTSPGMWILVKCGADIALAAQYQYQPWGWFLRQFRKEHPILDAILDHDFHYIANWLLNQWPDVREITRDPWSWVWTKLSQRWPDLPQITTSPGLWILVKCGADIAMAAQYQYQPWGWFIWKFRKEHPPLDAVIEHDTRWLFEWVIEALDRYLEDRTEWVISVSARVLNRIWETRV